MANAIEVFSTGPGEVSISGAPEQA